MYRDAVSPDSAPQPAFNHVRSTRVRRHVLALAAGLVVSGASVWILATRVDVGRIGSLITEANLGLVGLSLLTLAVSMLLRTFRWRAIFPATRTRQVSVAGLAPVVLIGYALNALIPLRAGDVARGVIGARRFGAGLPETLGSVGLERLLDAAALGIVAAAVSVGVVGPEWLVPIAIAVAVGSLGLVIALHLLALRRSPVRGAVAAGASVAWRVWDGLRASPRDIGLSLAFGAAAWCVDGATAWIIAGALGISLSWQVAVLVTAGAALGAVLPSAPAAIGTFHLAGSAVGVALGLTGPEALALVSLWHAITIVPLVMAGGISAPLLGLGVRELRAAARHGSAGTPRPIIDGVRP